MRQTSLQTFAEINRDGTLTQMQTRVYTTIACHPDSTDREITNLLGLNDPNAVRPRRFELLEHELIYESGQRPCRVTGKTAITWRVNE